jgi:hypothetical protein
MRNTTLQCLVFILYTTLIMSKVQYIDFDLEADALDNVNNSNLRKSTNIAINTFKLNQESDWKSELIFKPGKAPYYDDFDIVTGILSISETEYLLTYGSVGRVDKMLVNKKKVRQSKNLMGDRFKGLKLVNNGEEFLGIGSSLSVSLLNTSTLDINGTFRLDTNFNDVEIFQDEYFAYRKPYVFLQSFKNKDDYIIILNEAKSLVSHNDVLLIIEEEYIIYYNVKDKKEIKDVSIDFVPEHAIKLDENTLGIRTNTNDFVIFDLSTDTVTKTIKEVNYYDIKVTKLNAETIIYVNSKTQQLEILNWKTEEITRFEGFDHKTTEISRVNDSRFLLSFKGIYDYSKGN